MFSYSTGVSAQRALRLGSRLNAIVNSFRNGMSTRIIASCAMMIMIIVAVTPCFAQLSVSAQLRTRSELRDGQGTPSVADTVPAFFTSQRTRVSIGFTGYRFKLYSVIQDVRVWGQDASTVNRVTPSGQSSLMLHEAWGEISLL